MLWRFHPRIERFFWCPEAPREVLTSRPPAAATASRAPDDFGMMCPTLGLGRRREGGRKTKHGLMGNHPSRIHK
jgi:hypothetical protein